MNQSALDFCPVPQEQQPIYEYQKLQDSWFFSWATLPLKNYIRKLVWVGLGSLSISAPIAAASFAPASYPLKFFLASVGGSEFLTGLVLLRLYLGWCYIRDRLYSRTISYEESGWYDGQIWKKPQSMVNRDRLIVNYEIQPILLLCQKTFLFLAISGLIGSIIWFVY